MEEPYATFDTFTVGENFAPGEDPLAPPPQAPILARMPRLAVGGSVGGQKSNRFDPPESGMIGVHEPTATSAPAEAPTARGEVRGKDNPAATIRFDTVLTNDGYVEAGVEAGVETGTEAGRPETAPTADAQPVAARDQAISMLESPVQKSHKSPALYPAKEFDSWLLNLEATVMPYSRWIALAAVIAALGLTMILLRSSAPAVMGDAPLQGNQAGNPALTETFAVADKANSVPPASTLEGRKGLQSLDLQSLDLQPLESSPIITNTFATTAMGPTGQKAKPQARLAQQVQPIEPYRVSNSTERIEVAVRPPATNYPRTAANGPVAPATSNRSTLR